MMIVGWFALWLLWFRWDIYTCLYTCERKFFVFHSERTHTYSEPHTIRDETSERRSLQHSSALLE